MRSVLIPSYAAALVTVCTLVSSKAQSQNNAFAGKAPGEVIVQFKPDASDADLAGALRTSRIKLKRHVKTAEMAAKHEAGLTLADTEAPVEETLRQLRNNPAVEFAEENVHYTHQAASNDPYVTGGNNWGLYGDLSTPANAYGSQAAEAWQAGYTGDNKVYVAVIDEGIEVNHADLAANIWRNPFDPVDGIDNDGNGYVDDVNGWNFLANNNQVFTSGSDTHGTHVAGTIGAKGGNALGVAGVNWNVTILSGKFLGSSGGNTLDAVEAIDYFIDLKKRHGLNLVAINASWGGGGYSQALHAAIIRAAKAGILFVAAAGNDALNNDVSASYPANIDTRTGTSTESAASFDGVVSVAAIDRTGALASFSSYGATKVHLGAPGVQILSTYPTGGYAYMSGTSMATPHVTGAIALYASTHSSATAESIRTALLNATTATASLSGKTVTGGRLNLSTVITPTTAGPTVPSAPTGVAASANLGSVTVSWGSVAGATSYTVKRSTTSGSGFTALASTSAVNYTDSAVNGGVTYYYVVAANNAAGSSANSTQVSATPTAVSQGLAAPTGVSATITQATVPGNAAATISWNAVTGASSYAVKRATSASGPWAVVANGLTGTSWIQSVPATGTTFYYAVSATGAAGTSPDSAYTSVQALPPSPSNLTGTAASTSQVTLRWTDRCYDEQGFKVEYAIAGGVWTQFGTVGAGVTTATVSGLTSRSTYYFRVRAYNAVGNTDYSNTAAVTMP